MFFRFFRFDRLSHLSHFFRFSRDDAGSRIVIFRGRVYPPARWRRQRCFRDRIAVLYEFAHTFLHDFWTACNRNKTRTFFRSLRLALEATGLVKWISWEYNYGPHAAEVSVMFLIDVVVQWTLIAAIVSTILFCVVVVFLEVVLPLCRAWMSPRWRALRNWFGIRHNDADADADVEMLLLDDGSGGAATPEDEESVGLLTPQHT